MTKQPPTADDFLANVDNNDLIDEDLDELYEDQDDDRFVEALIGRQDAEEAKFKAKAKELGIHDLDKWKSPASDTDEIITDDEDC